jgi:hypothetical protein
MTVASDWDHDTWQVHLDGYLSLLQHASHDGFERSPIHLMEQALQFVRADTVETFSFDAATRNDQEKAVLLLHILKLQLRVIVEDYCKLTESVMRPRKLDMQRLRFLLQRLLDDIALLPTTLPLSNIVCRTAQLEHSTLRVVARGILIECGRLVDGTGAFDTSRECTKLKSLTRAAASETLGITATLYPNLGPNCMVTVARGQNVTRVAIRSTPMSAIWPLFAAGVWSSSCFDSGQRVHAREALFQIGKYYHIPRASYLVRLSSP